MDVYHIKGLFPVLFISVLAVCILFYCMEIVNHSHVTIKSSLISDNVVSSSSGLRRRPPNLVFRLGHSYNVV